MSDDGSFSKLESLQATQIELLRSDGERDRRQIARLTEALDVLLSWEPSRAPLLARLHPQHRAAVVAARAVLAGEEDAGDARDTLAGSTDE